MNQLKKIEIHSSTADFFYLYETNDSFSIEQLNSYYEKYPTVFNQYFQSHCPRTEERLLTAIAKYPAKYEQMKRVAKLLPSILNDVYEEMSNLLGIQPDLRVNILVGAFGSNAYVTHDGSLHFCIEAISDNLNHLKVLVAHEMAHAFHYELLYMKGFDFSKIKLDGYASIYLEGVATYISEIVNQNLPKHIYLSFDDSGKEWINFFEDQYAEIILSLIEDLKVWSIKEEREWFRLSGGERYGYNRLGYLVGKQFINDIVKKNRLESTCTLWCENDIKLIIDEWLINQGNLKNK